MRNSVTKNSSSISLLLVPPPPQKQQLQRLPRSTITEPLILSCPHQQNALPCSAPGCPPSARSPCYPLHARTCCPFRESAPVPWTMAWQGSKTTIDPVRAIYAKQLRPRENGAPCASVRGETTPGRLGGEKEIRYFLKLKAILMGRQRVQNQQRKSSCRKHRACACIRGVSRAPTRAALKLCERLPPQDHTHHNTAELLAPIPMKSEIHFARLGRGKGGYRNNVLNASRRFARPTRPRRR